VITKTVLVVGALTAGLVVPAAAGAPVRIAMPALSGPHPVGTAEVHLVDRGRVDPWVGGARELMATVSYPALPVGERAGWMGDGVADVVDRVTGPGVLGIPAGSVAWAQARRHARTAAPAFGKWPVVVFSHGLGSLREVTAGLVDDLASRGYVVLSLSHTHEATAIEFPDGRVATAVSDMADPAERRTAIDVRVADSRFALTALAGGDVALPRGLRRALDTGRVGIAGHSYGGFTAAEAMHVDRRFDAGINLDGAMGAPGVPSGAVEHGLDRPFLLVGADFVDPETGEVLRHSHRDTALDPTWARFWETQRGWKRDLHLHGGTHYAFTDLQFAVPRLRGLLTPEQYAFVVGTIEPRQSLAAQHDFLAGFFDLHLKGRDRGLFDRDPHRYPDVRFVP
jgi:dienelactone hydrolase